MRTLVLADIHAFPDLIFSAIEAEEKASGIKVERIVFAGDYIDIGPDPLAVLDFVENDPRVVSVLWGNHDAAIIAKQRISPQSPESWALRGRLLKHVDDWKLATVVDGVIITHAGISRVYDYQYQQRGIDGLCDYLNEEFRTDINDVLGEDGALFASLNMFTGEDEPLWYRPFPFSLPKSGFKQIAGHTPDGCYTEAQLKSMRDKGLRLIDPYCREIGNQVGRYKYAIVSDGHVRVKGGVLK